MIIKKKRIRRKANQIDRIFACTENNCSRSYGTEGALKMHIKTKHPFIHYDYCVTGKEIDSDDSDNMKDINNNKTIVKKTIQEKNESI